MRKKLQNGCLALPVMVFVAVVSICLVIYHSTHNPDFRRLLPDAMQKLAFVSAAFAVTAYNLRTRVVDFVLKLKARPRKMEELCRSARETGKRLTNLVILFTATAILMGSGILFDRGASTGSLWIVVSTACFAISCTNFLYVVFAFEKLEEFILQEHEELARDAEVDRLNK